MKIWWPYLVGYFFAIVIAHFPIKWVVNQMWQHLGWSKDEEESVIRGFAWMAQMVGCVERALYVASFQLGKIEFIGIWLALKVAGGWKRWGEEKKFDGRLILGRSFYQIFLIGNALSVGYALTGAKLVEWCLRREFALAIEVVVCLGLATLVLWCWERRYCKKGNAGVSRAKS